MNDIRFKNCVEKFRKVILNELLEEEIQCWVAGGSVRDYFMGIPIKTDIDIFFPDKNNYDKASNYFKKNNAIIKWESDKGMKILYKNKTFDIIKMFFKNPKETINAFDFTVSMFAVDKDNVYYDDMSFIDLSKRQLMINKITFPESTTSRMNRYLKKGFNICNGELYKIIKSIGDKYVEEYKLNQRDEIIDELVGNKNQTSSIELDLNDDLSSGDLIEIFSGID